MKPRPLRRLRFTLLLLSAVAVAAALAYLAAAPPPRPSPHPLLLSVASAAAIPAFQSDAAVLLDAYLSSYDIAGGNLRSLYLRRRLPSPVPGVSRAGRVLYRLRLQLPFPLATDEIFPIFRDELTNWLAPRGSAAAAAVLGDLVRLVKNPIDLHYGFPVSGKKYKSCAVVGNSGILLGAGYGVMIDAHEFVIRLNNARIAGFGPDVGEKTSLSFINSNVLHSCTRMAGCFCHPYGDNVPLVMYICQPAHFLDFVACRAWHKPPLLITDWRFDALCGAIAKYYSLLNFVTTTGRPLGDWNKTHDEKYFHYSSGLQTVVLALGLCEEVSAFGFGKMEGAQHHYHTNQKKELALHDYEAEYAFYRDLVTNPQQIPFFADIGFQLPRVEFNW